MKEHVSIWDFDGTIFNSPTKEEGKIVYLEHTGKLWPFSGWWGRIESLLPPIIPDPKNFLIQKVFDAFQQRQNHYNILMTGRPVKIRKRIQEILKSFNMNFHEEYYKGMREFPYFDDTFDYKAEIIKTKILHPNLKLLEIWEDRPEHVSRFTNLAKQFDCKTVIYDVTNL